MYGLGTAHSPLTVRHLHLDYELGVLNNQGIGKWRRFFANLSLAIRRATSAWVMVAIIQCGEPTKIIAQAIPYDPRNVRKAKARYRLFDSTKAPPNRVGYHKKVILYKWDVLLDGLADHPTTDRSQMVTFFRNKFEDEVSLSTISYLLKDTRWIRKNCRPITR